MEELGAWMVVSWRLLAGVWPDEGIVVSSVAFSALATVAARRAFREAVLRYRFAAESPNPNHLDLDKLFVCSGLGTICHSFY